MPYASARQRRFFHTDTAARAGITPAQVAEWDAASRGQRPPERAKDAAVRALLGVAGPPPLPKPPALPKPGSSVAGPTIKGAPAAAPPPPGVKS